MGQTPSLSINSLLVKSTPLNENEVESLLNMNVGDDLTLSAHLQEKSIHGVEEALIEIAAALGLNFQKDIPSNEIPVHLIQDISINFAKRHEILPFKENGDTVWVLITNPIETSVLNDLRVVFNKKITPVLTTKVKILDAINKVFEKTTAALQGLDEIEEEEYDLEEPILDLLESGEDDAPVIRLVNTLLFRAVKEKASDIHVEPYEKDMVVRFRIDGILFDIFKPPKKLQNAITSRIKVMGNLNIAEKRLPQDGRIPIKLGGKDIDIRLSSIPTGFGERLVLRLQDRANVVLELEQLGFSESTLNHLNNDLLQRTYGIVLVTGPTGSGKSTTLYACLSRMNSIDKNILTIEDPVEQRIHGIGQIQANPKIGLTFANGLRSILRQDPNIIMVGEIRDLDTAEIAINSSLTGHLVLSTIHTNDSAGVFPRLMDMGCEPFLIATSLLGVVAQRLVRVLCPHCKEPYEPTDMELRTLGITHDEVFDAKICKAVGCEHCNGKGFTGRTVIQELLLVNEEIRTLIMQRQDGGTIRKCAIQNGMQTFREHGIDKVLRGITTIEELVSNSQVDI